MVRFFNQPEALLSFGPGQENTCPGHPAPSFQDISFACGCFNTLKMFSRRLQYNIFEELPNTQLAT